MLVLLSLALATDLSSPWRTGAVAPDDYAVVVGIEEYFALPPVPYAEDDASAWADLFVYTRGIPSSRVVRLIGRPSREQIVAALEQAGRETPDGTVFVAFAGHGAADLSTGTPMVLPAETPTDPGGFSARGIPVEELHALASAGGGHTVVFTDACYTGAGRDGEALLPGARLAVPTWAAPATPDAVTFRATTSNQLAMPLDDVEHGAFSYVAVSGLRGAADGERDGTADGRVTSEELLLYTTRRLRELGVEGQTPTLVGGEHVVLVDAPDRLEGGVVDGPEEEEVELVAPVPAVTAVKAVKAVRARPPRPAGDAPRRVDLELALGSWTGLKLSHRWPGMFRRVGLESGVGIGWSDYFTCGNVSCGRAIEEDLEMTFHTSVVPFAHPLTAHVGLSPAKRGPWSNLELNGSLGLGVALHAEHVGALAVAGYSVTARWTHPKEQVFFSLGYAGVNGDPLSINERNFMWFETLTIAANVGVRLSTLWTARVGEGM